MAAFSPVPFSERLGLAADGDPARPLHARLEGLGELLLEPERCSLVTEAQPGFDLLRDAWARFASAHCAVSRSPSGRLCLTWSAAAGAVDEAGVLAELEEAAAFLQERGGR